MDALGYITSFAYDAAGNRVAETDALGQSTHYGYGALDRQVAITDALGVATTFVHPSGRLQSDWRSAEMVPAALRHLGLV